MLTGEKDTLDRYVYLDVETQSDVDLKKHSVYQYVQGEQFQLVLLSYAFGGGPVQTIDFTQYKTPQDAVADHEPFFKALVDDSVFKVAYNATFERNVLRAVFGPEYDGDPSAWRDPMVWVLALDKLGGSKASLEASGAQLGLPEDKAKLEEGKRLVKKFGKPVDIDPLDPDWDLYRTYNAQDVTALRAVTELLYSCRPSSTEQRNWALNERVNDNGIAVDVELAQKAQGYTATVKKESLSAMKELTGCVNPNSPTQLKEWLKTQDIPTDSLDKAAVKALLARQDLVPEVRQVLQLRQAYNLASLNTYSKLPTLLTRDNRLHGAMRFYGAHTGRWSSTGFNVQNLKRMEHSAEELGTARTWVKSGKAEMIPFVYPAPSDIYAELVRTLLIAPDGCVLIDSDFAQIEARVTQYLASLDAEADPRTNEVLKAFRRGEDVYCKTAEMMYHVPVQKNGENGYLRKYGKTATLACGYGGGLNALRRMGLSTTDASDTEAQSIVQKWRSANPLVVEEWHRLDTDVKACIRDQKPHGRFSMVWITDVPVLRMVLPSGRYQYYWSPHIETETKTRKDGTSWESEQLVTANGKSYWGGKLFENLVQSTARDILADKLRALDTAGLKLVFHVHDEVVLEVPKDRADAALQTVELIMKAPAAWAPELPLDTEPYTTPYFVKD